jgi:EpsD family peptidyl-prolyl cis-trans isomerase
MRDRLKAVARFCRVTTLIGLCGVALSGCGKQEQGAAAQGQVVAHIGDSVVTTQELENEFRLANVSAGKQKEPAVIRQVLGELVLRKYLVQQAVTSKLDREPGVLLDILRSRDLVLATDYVTHAVAAKPVTQEEVDKFIAGNPLKFANRQAVTVEQIVLPLGPDSKAAVDAVKDAKTLDEVDQKLTEMNVSHIRSPATFSSGEIPEEFFNVMQAKKADDVFFVRSGPNGVFFKVTGESARPLEGEAAANLARRLIRADRVKAETGMASVSANLEAKYEGNYASIMKTESKPPEKN